MMACAGVWEAVKVTLCLDSPEGHQSNHQDGGDLDVGAKDTLSFAWRALKESRYPNVNHLRLATEVDRY